MAEQNRKTPSYPGPAPTAPTALLNPPNQRAADTACMYDGQARQYEDINNDTWKKASERERISGKWCDRQWCGDVTIDINKPQYSPYIFNIAFIINININNLQVSLITGPHSCFLWQKKWNLHSDLTGDSIFAVFRSQGPLKVQLWLSPNSFKKPKNNCSGRRPSGETCPEGVSHLTSLT